MGGNQYSTTGTMEAIPTEPIGSIPRPPELIKAIEQYGDGHPSLAPMYEAAFAKVRARVQGTALAARMISG
jgi:methionine synthase II (cobalamin-independent)